MVKTHLESLEYFIFMLKMKNIASFNFNLLYKNYFVLITKGKNPSDYCELFFY